MDLKRNLLALFYLSEKIFKAKGGEVKVMTAIKLYGLDKPYLVKEGYQTIKRRVFTSELFFEVTLGGKKVCINKMTVEEFGQVDIENGSQKAKVKKSKKGKK